MCVPVFYCEQSKTFGKLSEHEEAMCFLKDENGAFRKRISVDEVYILFILQRPISSSILNDFTSNQHKLIWFYAIFKLEFLFVCLLVFWFIFFFFFNIVRVKGYSSEGA